MIMHRKLKLSVFAAVVVLTALACGAFGGDDPTAVPPTSPPATAVVQPTAEVLPTDPPEPTAPSAPTDAPLPTEPVGGEEPGAPIAITMVNGFLDNFETWTVVGLVQNNTDRAIDDIEIEVELFDADANLLWTDTAYADLYNLTPGEASTFSVKIYEELPSADNFVATVVGNSTAEIERVFLDIDHSIMTIDDSGDAHITGELVNNTDEPVVINSLSAATFDANGQIVMADSYNVTIRYLDPGTSGPFQSQHHRAGCGSEAIDNFRVFVDAERDSPADPTNLLFSDANNYLDYFDDLHLVGELTNNGDRTLNVRLVAGIYDAAGNVIDAAAVDLPIDSLPPGASSPFDFDFWGPLNYTDGFYDQAATYTIQVDGYWTWDTDRVLLDLTTANDANEFDEFGGTFTGDAVNNSGGEVDSVTVVVFLRDKQSGEVIAMGYDYIFDDIPDGGSAEYTVFVDPVANFDVSSAEFVIVVKAERP